VGFGCGFFSGAPKLSAQHRRERYGRVCEEARAPGLHSHFFSRSLSRPLSRTRARRKKKERHIPSLPPPLPPARGSLKVRGWRGRSLPPHSTGGGWARARAVVCSGRARGGGRARGIRARNTHAKEHPPRRRRRGPPWPSSPPGAERAGTLSLSRRPGAPQAVASLPMPALTTLFLLLLPSIGLLSHAKTNAPYHTQTTEPPLYVGGRPRRHRPLQARGRHRTAVREAGAAVSRNGRRCYDCRRRARARRRRRRRRDGH
jgi:hypothetical protein